MLAKPLARYLSGLRETHSLPARIVLWDGTEIPLGDAPRVTIRLLDRTAIMPLLDPSLDRLGNAYVTGHLDVEGSMPDVMRVVTDLADARSSAGIQGLLPRFARPHSKQFDRDAIAHHYDVSNEFYAHFLDSRMVYSCAYYRHDSDSLETAQLAKLEHVCRKLALQPGMKLLDIGCGWGALAMHAASHHGAVVTGITLSERQHELARERVRQAGLADRVEIRLQDYRDVPEHDFDRIVSVGMFEHVGLANLERYFTEVRDRLIPGGVALNHGITATDPDSRSVGRGAGEFIGRYVFPNGELPHVSLAIRALSAAGLELVDAESLRRHYARTLWDWSDRFETHLKTLCDMVGDERGRVWRAYLAGCAHGFAHGWMNIYQLLAVRPVVQADGQSFSLPMTRDWMYREAAS